MRKVSYFIFIIALIFPQFSAIGIKNQTPSAIVTRTEMSRAQPVTFHLCHVHFRVIQRKRAGAVGRRHTDALYFWVRALRARHSWRRPVTVQRAPNILEMLPPK